MSQTFYRGSQAANGSSLVEDVVDLRSLILGLWSCEISNMISNVMINVIDHVIRSQPHRSTSQIYTKIFL